MSKDTNTISKTEQRELDTHAKLRDQFADAFAAVETNDDGTTAQTLAEARDRIAGRLATAADRLRKRGYTLRNDDSAPVAPTRRETTAPIQARPSEYDWPRPAMDVLFDYLRACARTEFDPVRELRRYVNSNGKLFIHSTDWIEWLVANGMPASKPQAAVPLRELGLVVRATPIPTRDYAKGFYQGTLPEAVNDLPRRQSRRTRGPKTPFGKLTDAQRELLREALAGMTKSKLKGDREQMRDELLGHVAA